MKNWIVATGVIVSSISFSNAQTDADALRYTTPFAGSSARSTAVGGAFGAIGADFSSLSINPAGLGVYRKSEFVFSPSVQTTDKNSTFFGNTTIDSKSTINLQNWGVVFASKLGKDDDLPEWKYLNFGFGMNRYNILSNNIFIQGTNSISSIGDYFVTQANGKLSNNLDPFQSGLAYQAYFIDPNKDSLHYSSQSVGNVDKNQSKSINSVGSIGETVLSVSGNYSNKWFFGATIGIAKINYTESSVFTEEDVKNLSGNFKRLTYTENLTTKGNGLNMKIGTIYKPVDWLRMGMAIHTPTSYSLTDVYTASMTTDFDTTDQHSSSVDNSGGYTYSLRTPMRVIGSVGFIIGKRGFISIDDEYLDYRNALFSPAKDLNATNQLIKLKFTNTHNLKIGGELNLNPFAIRAGYTFLGNPFNSNITSNIAKTSYSLGLGFRNSNFFCDIAYILANIDDDRYYLYNSDNLPSAKITTQRSSIITSVGFRW